MYVVDYPIVAVSTMITFDITIKANDVPYLVVEADTDHEAFAWHETIWTSAADYDTEGDTITMDAFVHDSEGVLLSPQPTWFWKYFSFLNTEIMYAFEDIPNAEIGDYIVKIHIWD